MDRISKEESNKHKCIDLINDINMKHEQSVVSVDTNFTGGILSRDQILNKLSNVQEAIMAHSTLNKQTVAKIYQSEMDLI